jgi:hypothetical protein
MKTLATVLMLLVVLLGDSLTSCHENRGGGGSNRPPQDRQVDPATSRQVVIRAYSTEQPYLVKVDATDSSGGHDYWEEPTVTGIREYRQTLDYTSGLKIRIEVVVQAPNTDGVVTCSITDGPYNHNESGPVEGWRARCGLTTAR